MFPFVFFSIMFLVLSRKMCRGTRFLYVSKKKNSYHVSLHVSLIDAN